MIAIVHVHARVISMFTRARDRARARVHARADSVGRTAKQ
jgi:hypothetical protein